MSRSFIQIFALLQRLRQACNHPALTVKNRLNDSGMKINRSNRSRNQDTQNEEKGNEVSQNKEENVSR